MKTSYFIESGFDQMKKRSISSFKILILTDRWKKGQNKAIRYSDETKLSSVNSQPINFLWNEKKIAPRERERKKFFLIESFFERKFLKKKSPIAV